MWTVMVSGPHTRALKMHMETRESGHAENESRNTCYSQRERVWAAMNYGSDAAYMYRGTSLTSNSPPP